MTSIMANARMTEVISKCLIQRFLYLKYMLTEDDRQRSMIAEKKAILVSVISYISSIFSSDINQREAKKRAVTNEIITIALFEENSFS
ncbi:MAG: hypothetical protein VZQ83_09595 [Eubacterium sp.]|nr:hypothetical protein [Eubacterium sp.]